jgi:hypothetical protein
MKKYFIQNNDKQKGSFALDDLKEKVPTHKSMAWFFGIIVWTEAQFIPD